jgi:ATP phosphoribosyltransferase regulatory subunit
VTEALATLVAVFTAAGAERVEPPVLQPAEAFLDATGEELRRRLFLTQGLDGATLCLRPDYTIPVCRAHIAAGRSTRPALYAYGGPVFRQRPGELGEFLQAGIERLGDEDRASADADVLALSLRALDAVGFGARAIRIGDEALFAALMQALDLPAAWRQRLRSCFGDAARMDAMIDRLTTGDGTGGMLAHAGVIKVLSGQDRSGAQALVEDLIAIAGIDSIAGRTPREIAERFLDQASTAGAGVLDPVKADLIRSFLAIAAPLDTAVDRLRVFSTELARVTGQASEAMGAAIGGFAARRDAIAARGIAPSSLPFAAGFGRNLDYYTGFVFEIGAANAPTGTRPVVGGGRYDRLMTLLGAATPIPAVGCSIWIDRLEDRP